MKKTVKMFASIMIVVVLASMCSLWASALTFLSKSCNDSLKYEYGEWWNTTTYKSDSTSIGVLEWGFDPAGIDEDYSYTKGYFCSSQSAIRRVGYDSDYVWGPVSATNSWSMKNLIHKTDNMLYGFLLANTYSNITSTTTYGW